MTATALDKIALGDHSGPTERPRESNAARAERLLRRIADFGETVMNDLEDPLDVPDYVLAAVTQAGTALVQLALLDAHEAGPVEVLLDGGGDLWVVLDGIQFECQTAHHEPQTMEQIRAAFGIARKFVGAPPETTAQEATPR